jgi:hypothetical protein
VEVLTLGVYLKLAAKWFSWYGFGRDRIPTEDDLVWVEKDVWAR